MATGLARLLVGADPRRTLVRIGVLVVAAWLLITYGILSVRGQGPSMLPTVLIKRILAGPGDTIAIAEGMVTVNDVELVEPYVQHRARWNMRATTLTPDQFFVVGDNRGMPMAQHTFGTVDRADLIGPVFWVVGN